jgi:hypothetical protein
MAATADIFIGISHITPLRDDFRRQPALSRRLFRYIAAAFAADIDDSHFSRYALRRHATPF